MTTSLSVKIGKRIKALRNLKGLTQAGLAEMVGITHKSLGRIERGQQCAIDTLDEIRISLGCTFADLMD